MHRLHVCERSSEPERKSEMLSCSAHNAGVRHAASITVDRKLDEPQLAKLEIQRLAALLFLLDMQKHTPQIQVVPVFSLELIPA